MAGCGRHVDLNRQPQVFLQQVVGNVLNAFKPRHFGVMDVVGFVIENGQFVNVTHHFTQIHFAVGGFAHGFGAKGR